MSFLNDDEKYQIEVFCHLLMANKFSLFKICYFIYI